MNERGLNAGSEFGLYINGHWRRASSGQSMPIIDPATGDTIGNVALATPEDIGEAIDACRAGFSVWRETPPIERQRILQEAAGNMRAAQDAIAEDLTRETGKPLAESHQELGAAIDILVWCAEEGKRAYGRVVPSRMPGVQHTVFKEPVGPVAAFTPWNFPALNFMRKVAGALGAGCSIIIKGSELTPITGIRLVEALDKAGLPKGVLSLLYGDPPTISQALIDSSVIKKLSFTGSQPVGRHLYRLAADKMIKVSMELGGHAPCLVLADADIERAAKSLCAAKFRNAGQVCVSPTRFIVESPVYDAFVTAFQAEAEKMVVGNGLDPATTMGPLINTDRVSAVEDLIKDAVLSGAQLRWQGTVTQSAGNFFPPTILTDVPVGARIMNEEPFGPVAAMAPASDLTDAIEEANRLPLGLAAYAFTQDAASAARLRAGIEAGMVAINMAQVASAETPFGGIGQSGFGSEGGIEGLDAYLRTRTVTETYH